MKPIDVKVLGVVACSAVQGYPCTAQRYRACRQLARVRRRRRKGSGHTDLPFCLRTEATAGLASWICPTASPWLWREVQQSQVSPLKTGLTG